MTRSRLSGLVVLLLLLPASVALPQASSPFHGAATRAQVEARPIARLSDDQKRAFLGRAANLSADQANRLQLFTSATMTPRQPAVGGGGFYFERASQYDPLRDLIAFYGSQGNLSVRFSPGNLVAKMYLVDVMIRSELSGPADFRMEAGAGGAGSVGEGFVSELSQTLRVAPGEQHLTMAVRPKDSRWYWVMILCKAQDGNWFVRAAEVTAVR